MINRLKQLRSLNPTVKPLQQSDLIASQNTQDRIQKYQDKQQGIQQQFFQNVKSAKTMIAQIVANNQKILQLKGKYTKAIKLAQQKQTTENLSSVLDQNKTLHSKLKKILDQIKKSSQNAQKQMPDEPQTRMKKNFYIAITREFTQTLKLQGEKQDGFKQSVKQKVTRQVKLIDPTLNQHEVEKYVQNPQQANKKLQQMIYGKGSLNLQNAVSDIQDKFRDIQKLEQAVSECLALFKQLALLVQKQGELIDDIEQNVLKTKDYIQKANQHLKKAKEHHQCSRKLMCGIIIVAIIILVIIIAPILSTTLKKA